MADTPIAIRPFVAGALAPIAELSEPDNVRVVLYTGTQQVHVPLKELLKFASPSPPSGLVASFAMQTPPVGWLLCNGDAVSRQDYADLFEAIGTQWGAGDGSTTFNVPNLQGQFLRGWPGGIDDPDRQFGSKQGDAIRNITGAIQTNGTWGFDGFGSAYGAFYKADTRLNIRVENVTGATDQDKTDTVYFDTSRIVATAQENRPKNIALLFCIKT